MERRDRVGWLCFGLFHALLFGACTGRAEVQYAQALTAIGDSLVAAVHVIDSIDGDLYNKGVRVSLHFSKDSTVIWTQRVGPTLLKARDRVDQAVEDLELVPVPGRLRPLNSHVASIFASISNSAHMTYASLVCAGFGCKTINWGLEFSAEHVAHSGIVAYKRERDRLAREVPKGVRSFPLLDTLVALYPERSQ